MCGIAGIIRFDGRAVRDEQLTAMTRALGHRGPDGQGQALKNSVGLAHTRLSIIDPVGGYQPMRDPTRKTWISFNGELYNYKELRQALIRKGHQFQTASDTEVVLKAYAEWGESCVNHFRGMFAFAILDWREQRLFLTRDHFGIKPLFFHQSERIFAFGSEIQALKTIKEIPIKADLQAVNEYLFLQYVLPPRTAIKSIRKLPPGSSISISFDGETKGPERYWRPEFVPDYSKSEAEWVEIVDAAIQQSVRYHMVSDVPFGAFLSGGVDSSLVVKYMSRLLNRPVSAFTVGFQNREFDEAPFAKFAAEAAGAQHRVKVIQEDALQVVPRLVKHYGDLFGDSSAIPTYFLSEFASREYKMVLSGDGADEMFAGYWSHTDWMTKIFAKNSRTPGHEDWIRLVGQMNEKTLRSLWRPEMLDKLSPLHDRFSDVFRQAEELGGSSKVQFADLVSYLPGVILRKVDTASMMHGLEVRTPFVDVELFRTVSRIPPDLHMKQVAKNEWRGKCLLKKVAEKYFPQDFVHRPKQGFAIPLEEWLLGNEQRESDILDNLCAVDSPLNEYFNPDSIKLLISRKVARPLWLLLVLQEWFYQNDAEVT